MIQFKEKSKQNANFSVGLLTYPVLMAADILYCDADLVPVGIDQKQHVELARNIAERFNNKYKKVFKLPEPLISSTGTKIKDLKDPTKKMSKSEDNPAGVISMFDDYDTIVKKISKATTDSDNQIKFDEENKPGISNLINIYASLTDLSIKEVEEKFKDTNYGMFKQIVGETVASHITAIQKKYNELLNSDEIDKILDDGLNKTLELAKTKYDSMKKALGVVREDITK